MNNIMHNSTRTSAIVNERVVYEYFRLIKNKDINRLLDLFTDDAIIYEPFSNIDGGLRGKSAIKPFLEVATMANDGMQYEIEFEQHQQQTSINNREQVTALVTFERLGRVQARFTFELKSKPEQYIYRERGKRIQILRIEFIK